MPLPFPGMDPYPEGSLWPDVHSALAAKVRQMLAPQVRPRYVVRLAVYLIEDTAPETELGILYPDVEVLHSYVASVSLPGDALAQSGDAGRSLAGWFGQDAAHHPGSPAAARSDAVLDLQAALTAVYDEAGYDLSIDYSQPAASAAVVKLTTPRRR